MRRVTGANRRGFTLTELTIVILMAAFVTLSIGVALVDSQRGWSRMYNRVYSGVVTDAFVARKAFDATVRKSSKEYDPAGGSEAFLYYYRHFADSRNHTGS